MGMTVKDIRDELDARDIAYDKKAKKADLVALLEASTEDPQVEAETVTKDESPKLLQLPDERVWSKYEEEQDRIERGYDLVNDNLDKSKTHLIRELATLSIPASYIARMLGAHYSFVHTVISTAGLPVVEKRTKSDEMREHFAAGKTVSQVSKLMGAHYSYVHGVYKRWQQ